MSPYPQHPPQGGTPPQPPPTGGTSLVVLFVLMGVGAMITVGGGVFLLAARATHRGHAVPPSGTTAAPVADLPPVTRHVPNHPLSILDGCSAADVNALVAGIDDAIEVGAPLYNSGNRAQAAGGVLGALAGARGRAQARGFRGRPEQPGVGDEGRVRRADPRGGEASEGPLTPAATAPSS